MAGKRLGYGKRADKLKQVAKERILKLFAMAGDVFERNPFLSHRYVALARKISMRFRVRIPKEFKRSFCKHCLKFLKPGKNCTIRLLNQKLVYHCLECNKYMRFPYVREKKQIRKTKAKNRIKGSDKAKIRKFSGSLKKSRTPKTIKKRVFSKSRQKIKKK